MPKAQRHMSASALSGGQQKMVAIGRGLMSNPGILMCDELSLGLSPVVVNDIHGGFPRIRADGLSLIVVAQDIDSAIRVADYVCCFMHGCVTLHGSPASLTREQISTPYFGVERL